MTEMMNEGVPLKKKCGKTRFYQKYIKRLMDIVICVVALPVFALIFIVVGIAIKEMCIRDRYNIMWQLAGSKELLKMVCFMGAGGLLTLAMNVIFAVGLSNSVLILTCMCAIALIGCMRLILRVTYKLRRQRRDRGEGEKSARDNGCLLYPSRCV